MVGSVLVARSVLVDRSVGVSVALEEGGLRGVGVRSEAPSVSEMSPSVVVRPSSVRWVAMSLTLTGESRSSSDKAL